MRTTEINVLLELLAASSDLWPFQGLADPLKAHDREDNSDLVRTLKVYFTTNANASETADRLFLHRNPYPTA
jgi:DNA-binding PucR family transcriptional regulator